MLETEGIVVKTGLDGADVETSRSSACGGCSSNQSCGTTTLTQLLGSKITSFKVLNPIGAVVGDRVVIGLEESALLKSSALAYLTPLALLLAGAIFGSQLAPAGEPADLYSAWGAGIGIFLGFLALKLISARAVSKRHFQPVILRRLLSHNIVKFAEDRER